MPKTRFKYCLLVGWAENRWKTSDLVSILAARGATQTNNPDIADVVIGHSAGCHHIRPAKNQKLLLLIGPLYGRQPLFIRTSQEWFFDSLYYFKKGLVIKWLLKNIYYLYFGLRHPQVTLKVYRQVRKPLPAKAINSYKKVLVVRNSRDHFCERSIQELVKTWPAASLVQPEGHHDDLWTNPRLYVDLIIKEL